MFSTSLTKLEPIFKGWIREVLAESKVASEQPKPPATRQQAAKFLGLSLPTLDTLIRTGQLNAFNIGRQVRIDWDQLDLFVKKRGAA